jgi:formylglycine-generating enzyme required for sulfatase activity
MTQVQKKCKMNWFKRLFGGEEKRTPVTPQKPKAVSVTPASLAPNPPAAASPIPKRVSTSLLIQQSDPLILTLAPGITLPLVRVPASEFTMGSSNVNYDARHDEQPQHKVYLDEYLIGKYAVTVVQFRAFVQTSGYKADNAALRCALARMTTRSTM